MLCLLLDECISPRVSRLLWDAGLDNWAARDRGLLAAPDYQIWEYALAENRAVVTINYGDFRSLAARTESHPGLIVIPSGHAPPQQYSLIMGAMDFAKSRDPIMADIRNTLVQVGEDGIVAAHALCAGRTASSKSGID